MPAIGNHLSDLALDRLLAQDPYGDPSGAREHLDACPHCQQRLEQFKQHDAAALRRYPSWEAAQEGTKRRRQRAAGYRFRPLFGVGLSVAAAAAAVCLVVALKQPDAPNSTLADPAVRTKGESLVLVMVLRGKRSTRYAGQRLRAGDRLAFRLTTKHRYLLVVGLEQRGTFSAYLAGPGKKLSRRISPGKRITLKDGVKLDDYPGAERFYLLLSDRPLNVATIQKRAARRFKAAGVAAKRVLKLGQLAQGVEQLSWLVQRETTAKGGP